MSGDIIKFPPTSEPAPSAATATANVHPWDCHAQAFRNLEPEICDCAHMAGIAAELIMNEDDSAPFAVHHLHEMLRRLKQEYYAAHHGDEEAIGRHAIVGDE